MAHEAWLALQKSRRVRGAPATSRVVCQTLSIEPPERPGVRPFYRRGNGMDPASQLA